MGVVSDDLKQIKQMLWELNCKLEGLSHKDDFVFQNGILVPKEHILQKGDRDWTGGIDWAFPMTTAAHEDRLKKEKEQKWKAITTSKGTTRKVPRDVYERMMRMDWIFGRG